MKPQKEVKAKSRKVKALPPERKPPPATRPEPAVGEQKAEGRKVKALPPERKPPPADRPAPAVGEQKAESRKVKALPPEREQPPTARPAPSELQTENPQLQTEKMEVHHHPQLEHKPKPWKEYLLEGLMIFLAVTMGFFAESLREHITDRDKEDQYMQAMVVDLQKDSVQINSEIVNTNYLMGELDSLFTGLHSPQLTDSIQLKLYRLSAKSNMLVGFEFSDAASVQLKNTGGIRLIQSPQVTDAIIHYWQTREGVKEDMAVFNRNAEAFWNEGMKIFDLYNIKNIVRPEIKRAGLEIKSNAQLLTHDKLQLTEYANRAGSLMIALKTHYLVSLQKQKVIESELNQLINKTYKF